MMNYFRMAPFLLVSLILPCIGNAEDISKSSEMPNAPFKVHGRLSASNGNPLYRIWIVGTKRILGVPGGDLEPAEMPKELEQIFHSLVEEGRDPTSIGIYADFKVTPLTEYNQGYMQYVRINSVENLVIYCDGKLIKKLKKL